MMKRYHVQQNSRCQCNVCQDERFNKFSLKLIHSRNKDLRIDPFYKEFYEEAKVDESKVKITSSSSRMNKKILSERKSNTNCYSFLLIKLMPKFSNLGMRIFVPDTVVYANGEPIFTTYNSKDRYMRFLRARERLSNFELRKFLLERRKKKEMELQMNKEAQTFLEKMKQGISSISSENKISSTEMQFNTILEFCLVKYIDGTTQVLNEIDFTHLMIKRRVERVWKEIDYIQTLLSVPYTNENIVKFKFVREHWKTDALYNKALNDVCLYSEKSSNPSSETVSNFLEEEMETFEKSLRNQSALEIVKYYTFKIVHYLEAFHELKIEKVRTEFLINEYSELSFVNATHLKFIDKAETKDLAVLQKVNLLEKEERNRIKNNLLKYTEKASDFERKKIGEILDVFSRDYEKVKGDLDIDIDRKTPENSFSDNVFSKVNPYCPHKLSDILKRRVESKVDCNLFLQINFKLEAGIKKKNFFLASIKKENDKIGFQRSVSSAVSNNIAKGKKAKISFDFNEKKLENQKMASLSKYGKKNLLRTLPFLLTNNS